MNPKTRLIAITAVFLAALGSHAYAGDNKVYPGAMCQPHDGTLSNFDRFGGKFRNLSSNASINVVCPVVRDNTGNPVAGGRPSAIVAVFHPSVATTACFQQTFRTDGTVRDFQRKDFQFAGLRDFIFETNQSPGGAYQVFCFLPPKGELVRYSLAEPD